MCMDILYIIQRKLESINYSLIILICVSVYLLIMLLYLIQRNSVGIKYSLKQYINTCKDSLTF